MKHWVFWFGLAAVILQGCDSGKKQSQRERYDMPTLLSNLGSHVFLPAYREAASAAADLKTATAAYMAALAADSTAPTEKAAAEAAWREAMIAWQAVEVNFKFFCLTQIA